MFVDPAPSYRFIRDDEKVFTGYWRTLADFQTVASKKYGDIFYVLNESF